MSPTLKKAFEDLEKSSLKVKAQRDECLEAIKECLEEFDNNSCIDAPFFAQSLRELISKIEVQS